MENLMKHILRLAMPIVLGCMAFSGTQSVQATQIVVGQVAPLSGPEAGQGRAYAAGMQLVFSDINKSGGVNGHTFTLVSKDDGGRPENTVPITRQLLAENQPMVLAGYFGSRNLSELVSTGLLEKERLGLVGYRAAEIRAETPFLYNVRTNLRTELSKITEHLAAIGVTRLGLLYEDGPSAAGLVAATEDVAKKDNATIISKASYEAGTTRVGDAIDAFIKTKPQAIILVCSGAAGARFIEQYRADGGAAQIFVHSGADMERVTKRIAEDRLAFVSTVMRGVAIAQVVPNPYDTSKLAKELNVAVTNAGKLDVPVSYVLMEGYIAAKVIVEAVRRQGKRPTREGMAAALESIDGLNLGGYVVGFKPGMRVGSKFVELSIISDTGKIRQ
jgi:ABC-type branched-subunit amino acid transport system substrate-binding protein